MTACSIQAAILAGGQSRRMGHDKSFLDLNGKPLIQNVIDPLRSLGLDIMLITNTPTLYAHLDLPMFTDELPNNGSLGGLYTALAKATAPRSAWRSTAIRSPSLAKAASCRQQMSRG